MFMSIFRGKARGIGQTPEDSVYMKVGVDLRKHLHHFKGARLAIFMAIALHADEEGLSFPSYETLERETGYKSDTIAAALKELCKLEIEGHRVLVKYREKDEKKRYVGGNRYLIFPTQEECQMWDKPDVEKSRCGKIQVEEDPLSKAEPLLKEEPLTNPHIEKPNNGFSRVSPTEHPQAQQPSKRTTKQVPLSSQSALFESPPSASVEPLPSQQRKPDAMYDAICLAWKTEGGMAGKIQQQLLGKMPKKHPHHASNFAEPATPDEVASFAKWYRNRYPGCDMPMSPEKIQHHFAAFRRETGEAARKNAPKIREQNGRRLKYDSTLQSWLDIGPAQVPPPLSTRSQNEAYAQ